MAKSRARDGLYTRENGIFAFRYKNSDGLWREKYTGTADRREARDIKKKFLDQLADGELPTDMAKWTVEQAATQWVEQHAAHLTSEKARSNEKYYLRQLVKRLGNRRLESITLADLKNYQAQRRKQVRERPVNLELRILVNVLKENHLWKSVGEHYKSLKEPESDVGQALTKDQLKHLEETARTNDGWLVAYNAEVLAANTGLRGGEIKKLRLVDVDLDKKEIRVRRRATKTSAGARFIALNEAATQAAMTLRARALAVGAREPEHYLLPADLSKHTQDYDPFRGRRGFDPTMHQRSWDTAWRNLRKAAGFASLRFHDLRHTFVTLMGEKGVPLQILQTMVGHMSAAMVRYYTHISGHAVRDAVALLDEPKSPQPAEEEKSAKEQIRVLSFKAKVAT